MEAVTQTIRSEEPAVGEYNEESRWYAVHTRARHEAKIARLLQLREIAFLLPTVRERHRWSDRLQEVQVPLFPCYLFVQIRCDSQAALPILQIPGVLGIVSFCGRRAPIPTYEILHIQRMLDSNSAVSPHAFVKTGQRVRILGGCLDGVEGIIVSDGSSRKIVVSINVIERSIAVALDGYEVEPL